MSDLGVVAILFTDLVGSTELLARLGDDAAEVLRREHFEILRHEVARAGGQEVKSIGDGLMVVFHSPLEAVGCAVGIQQAVDRRNQAAPDRAVGVRVGLNVGEPARDGDAGDAGGAAGAAARLETCARMLDVDLYRALACTAAAAGRAVDALRPLGYRAFLARALDVLGRAHSGVDPQQATEARTEAARIFDECGASWRRDRVLGLPARVEGNLTGGQR